MENDKIKLIKEFVYNEDCVIFLLKLKNGKLCTCSQDREIKIFNPENFICEKTIYGHLNSINAICELDNEILVSCSDDNKINIWDLKNKENNLIYSILAHNSYINKVITLKNGNFASCSDDKLIKIWNHKFPFENLFIINEHYNIVTSIIELEDERLVSTSDHKENILRFYSFDNKKNKYIIDGIINNIHCHCINSLIIYKRNKIAIGSYKLIYIIDCDLYQIESIIQGHNTLITSLVVMPDGNLISVEEELVMKKYNYLFQTTCKIKYVHEQIIFSMISLSNNILITASKDGVIKVWNYS